MGEHDHYLSVQFDHVLEDLRVVCPLEVFMCCKTPPYCSTVGWFMDNLKEASFVHSKVTSNWLVDR